MVRQNSNPAESICLQRDTIFFISGPCVIESEKLCLLIAERIASLADKHNITIIFKASYYKANRTSKSSFRGPGLKKGLEILQKVKKHTALPVTTDVHTTEEIIPVAEVADIIQIPAFLCRQTDILEMAGKTGKFVNIKKGQFMSPADMKYAVEKAGEKSMLTERGSFFGYNRLVVDFTGIHTMKEFGVPVIFDATHSIQLPGGGKGCSSGNREMAIPMANAALCQGVDGLFFEVHPEPENALCDSSNTIYLSEFEKNLPRFIELHKKILDWK